MKIIEALKKKKELIKKSADLRAKIKLHCADLDFETPVYPDQRSVVAGWLQGHSDILKEILQLASDIAFTNCTVLVPIQIGDVTITKTIQEWIVRRRELAKLEQDAWASLTRRGLSEGQAKTSSGEIQQVKVRTYFDIKERDEKVSLYSEEPSLIDAKLEITNAVTELETRR